MKQVLIKPASLFVYETGDAAHISRVLAAAMLARKKAALEASE
jgi:hypothetical protein